VLIVDDDPRFAEIVGAALEDDGYDVVGLVPDAAGVEGAIEHLHPDVVVLDVVLGDGDGVDVAEELREHGEDVPVVLFSSLFDRRLSLVIQQSGFGFVEKAAGPDALESAIDAVVDLRDHRPV
jgi:DNA-binding response OmpR family regulator